jgi:WD40 repeat protein
MDTTVDIAQPNFYVTGGTLQRNAPSYVRRQADEELYAGLSASHFCYVLTSRQMGKSSLMVRMAARLRAEGVAVTVLDLTAVGQNLTAEQWYDGLLSSAGQQLKLEDELEDFWLDNERTGPLQRWMRAIREVVLTRLKGRVVIFIDEIDAVRSLPFSTDEFFAGIREFYNRRTEDAELQRLTFCLLGVATPSDLIQDTRTTPFNIGQRIELTDFTEAEAVPLAAGLGRAEQLGASLLRRVLYWTGGHPYLTQQLCKAIAEDGNVQTTAGVDRLCEELFLSNRARERDDNLLFVRDRLLRSEADRAALLDLYAQVRTHKRRVRDDETNPFVSILRLSGITRIAAGYHYVRNRIYYRVFDREWITANMPDAELQRQQAAFRRGLMRAAAVAGVILFIVSGLAFATYREKRRADHNAAALKKALDLSEEQRKLLIKQQEMEERQAKLEEQVAQARRQEKLSEEQRALAEQQRQLAEQNQQQALIQQRIIAQQRDLELQQRNQAERAMQESAKTELHTRRLLYAVHMSQAQQAWDEANLARVQKLLGTYQPEASAAPATGADPDVRGFEWYYLWRLAHSARTSVHLPQDGTPYLSAFSQDGKRVALATQESNALDPTKRREYFAVWDSTTGQSIREFDKLGYVNAATFSPDGTKLLTGLSDNQATLWDVATGRELATFIHITAKTDKTERTPGLPRRISFEVTSARQPVSVRSAAYTPGICCIAPSVNVVAFSPDGQTAATALSNFGAREKDYSIKLWDVRAKQEIASLEGHTKDVSALVFSPDGRMLASSSSDATVKLWLVPARGGAGQKLTAASTLEYQSASTVNALAFARDGKTLAAATDQSVLLWDMKTMPIQQQAEIYTKHEKPIAAIVFSPDGKRFATASEDKTIKLWNVPGREETQPGQAHGPEERGAYLSPAQAQTWLQTVAYRPAGAPHAGGAYGLLPLSGTGLTELTQEIEAVALEPVTTLKGHGGPILSVMFSQDGRELWTAAADGDVKAWPVNTEAEWTNLGTQIGTVYGLAFSPDGRTVAAGGKSGLEEQPTVKVWDAATGRERFALRAGSVVNNLAYSPDGKLLATAGASDGIKLWSTTTGAQVGAFEASVPAPSAGRQIAAALDTHVPILSVSFSPDSRLIAAGDAEGSVQILDVNTRRLVRILKGHTEGVEVVPFSPDGQLLATVSQDGTVKLWAVGSWQELATFKGSAKGSVKGFRAAAFSPDSRLLVTGGMDNRVTLWDAASRSPSPLASLEGHAAPVTYIAFAHDGKRIATSSADGTCKLWDVTSQQEVATLKGHEGVVHVVAFSPDGMTIATGGQDGTVKLWHAEQHTTDK